MPSWRTAPSRPTRCSRSALPCYGTVVLPQGAVLDGHLFVRDLAEPGPADRPTSCESTSSCPRRHWCAMGKGAVAGRAPPVGHLRLKAAPPCHPRVGPSVNTGLSLTAAPHLRIDPLQAPPPCSSRRTTTLNGARAALATTVHETGAPRWGRPVLAVGVSGRHRCRAWTRRPPSRDRYSGSPRPRISMKEFFSERSRSGYEEQALVH